MHIPPGCVIYTEAIDLIYEKVIPISLIPFIQERVGLGVDSYT
jgi:hypothetical protein